MTATQELPVRTRAPQRVATERRFRLSDGCELFYRAWAPAVASSEAVVLFHRGHEHSGRWQDLVDRIDLEDHWIFAWDARGHGQSEGERGSAESCARLVRDADEFVRHLEITHGVPVDRMAVVAHSVGAVIATTWVHDYAPPIRALVLANPAFRVKLYLPFAIPGLRLLKKIHRNASIRSYVRPAMLTGDAEEARAIADDELYSRRIAVNVLLDLHDTSTRLLDDAGAIRVPTLLMVSGRDHVVSTEAQLDFFDRLGSPRKCLESYPDFRHSTFHETDRARPIARAREFILQPRDPEPPSVLLDADRSGPTQTRYESLRLPLSCCSAGRLMHGISRRALNTAGRLSRGVRIGWRTGFDSGESLDHVYRNQAQGITPIGRLIDRQYLDSPGWVGIRQRKVHLEELLDLAIARRRPDVPTHLLDIAAGPGRYILETLLRHREQSRVLTATLRDRDRGGLEAGRELARTLEIDGATHEEGDAFDEESLASLSPRPDIAIVSGLYELFPENAPVRRSLAGLGQAVLPGGFLVYTNQPWHPQQEMIARVLPNRDGEPWVMRCRSQAEMDALVAEAGFRKIEQRIDDAGIFTVSLAERIG